MPLATGSKLGPYEIIGSIGAGGMGEVYRARDSRLQRDVAIKVLPASFASDPERLRRFEQEARVVGALNHPNIVAVHDVGSHEQGPYLVSELLEGESLRRHLDGTALPARKAIEYGMQIARGLAAAHEKGIVHRDLKPDNVFVLNDGRIKILDFGLAKLVREESFAAVAGSQTIGEAGTTPGQVLGTVGYMAPEQVRGQAADARSDIFAFGAILYEMLSGKVAFHRDSSVETLNAILKEEPHELSEVVPNMSPGLERVVRHCLEKNPAQRFQSASDIAFDLEMLSTQSGTGTRLKAAAEERRSRWKLVGLATIALGAMLAAVYLAARRGPPPLSPRFHQLTFQRGTIYGAKFAPDGQSILYSAAWNGAAQEQVYTTRTDALMSRPIELPDADVLSISTKGEMAIRQKTDSGPVPRGMLAVVPLTGGAPRDLQGDVMHASWSPDGQSLAVVHFVGPECRLEYPLGKTIYSSTTGMVSNVAISADGKQIAFFDHPNAGDSRGFVAVADPSGKVKRLTKEYSDLTGLAWSPGGNEIWFTGSDAGINSALYAVDLGGHLRDLLHIPGRLHVFDVGKSGEVLIANEVTRNEAWGRRNGQDRDMDLSWFDWTLARALSDDGQWVVLEEDGEGGGSDYTVFLRKTDGSPAIRLGSGMGLAISPDNKWVASTAVRQPAPIILLPAGAGQPITLGDGQFFHRAAARFLPDGKSILLVAAASGQAPRTFIEALDGSPPRPFGPEGFLGVAVSPDGKSVVGRYHDANVLLPFTGEQKPQPLAGVKPEEVVIGWTPDSQSIYVAKPDSTQVKVDILDLKTGTRKLHHAHAPADRAGVLGIGVGRITPDGSFYVYSSGRTLSYLYVVDGLK